MADPATRLQAVETRIATAAEQAGRDASDIHLIAVSKTFEPDMIEPVLAAGHREFGENRVQEALGKWPRLTDRFSGVRLHLIGPLQTNKVREAVALFDVIHTIDRDKLAGEIAREMARQGRVLSLFVQVNTGAEPQKSGVLPQKAVELVERCRNEHGLAIEGLMCLPPLKDDPVPHFDMLRRLGEALELPSLSMGMSVDFETAIAHGATHVRVGSAIFGARG